MQISYHICITKSYHISASPGVFKSLNFLGLSLYFVFFVIFKWFCLFYQFKSQSFYAIYVYKFRITYVLLEVITFQHHQAFLTSFGAAAAAVACVATAEWVLVSVFFKSCPGLAWRNDALQTTLFETFLLTNSSRELLIIFDSSTIS